MSLIWHGRDPWILLIGYTQRLVIIVVVRKSTGVLFLLNYQLKLGAGRNTDGKNPAEIG